jgi:pyridoxine/pyridoxamine 5'-phosphate oxidase
MSESAVRAIVEANTYMTLATADEEGRPWASPVWYATADCREFFWVSKPEARHSRNLAVRPGLAIVIFDSRQAPGTVEALYVNATAEQVLAADFDRGLEVFSNISRAQSLPPWSLEDVLPPARHRLYHATASEHFLLTSTDERLPVAMP